MTETAVRHQKNSPNSLSEPQTPRTKQRSRPDEPVEVSEEAETAIQTYLQIIHEHAESDFVGSMRHDAELIDVDALSPE